jgi:dTDP-4-dehydrorhamnose reductase
MKRSVLLTGKTGQIGSQLYGFLSPLSQVFAPERTELDLARPESIRRVIREVRPQLVVNAGAYTAVDAAENDATSAFAVNAEALAVLSEEAKGVDALLVHYSTDYVFDGTKGSPYIETDATNPLNTYGKSKLAGEQAIRESGVAHVILRTSWVYATRGRNFLLTILRLACEREELRVVSDQTGAPTCAEEIAAATSKILERVFAPDNRPAMELCGTYHMTAGGETTWYGFAKAILEEASHASAEPAWFAAATKGHPLIARRVVAIPTAEFPTPARRPAYSVLSNARLLESFGTQLPDWRSQVHRCFEIRKR